MFFTTRQQKLNGGELVNELRAQRSLAMQYGNNKNQTKNNKHCVDMPASYLLTFHTCTHNTATGKCTWLFLLFFCCWRCFRPICSLTLSNGQGVCLRLETFFFRWVGNEDGFDVWMKPVGCTKNVLWWTHSYCCTYWCFLENIVVNVVVFCDYCVCCFLITKLANVVPCIGIQLELHKMGLCHDEPKFKNFCIECSLKEKYMVKNFEIVV